MRNLLLILLAFIPFISSGQYCTPTTRCPNDSDPNNVILSDSLLFIDIDGQRFNPGNNCPTLTDETSNTLAVSPDGSTVSTQNAQYTDAVVNGWVDWNNDQTFSEDEIVAVPGHISTGQSGVILPPDGVTEGIFRMRLHLANSVGVATNGGPTACFGGNLVYHIVDFLIEVGGEPVMPPPSGPGYCAARGPQVELCDERIIRVTVANIENLSDSLDCAANNAYTDYTTDANLEIVIDPLTQYPIEVATANYLDRLVMVWVDWNQDKVFDETEATALTPTTGPIALNGESLNNGAIVPPADAPLGFTRMRIRVDFSANAPLDPCGTGSAYGEVEDYLVNVGNVEPLPSCAENQSPIDGFAQACQTSITFTWDSATVADGKTEGFKFSLGQDMNQPSGIYNELDLGDTLSFTLPDSISLNANSTYFWIINAYNSSGDGTPCDTLSFTTSANGDPVVSIEANGADVAAFNACLGTVENLEAVVAGGTTPLNFTWNGDDVALLGNTNAANNTFTGTTEESYQFYVDVVDDNGCAASDTIDIDVLPAAVAGMITGDDELCADEELLLQTANFTGDVQWQLSADGTNWNDINGETAATFNSLNPSDGLFYRVKATNGDCEDFSNEIEVTVFSQSPAPSILSATGDNFFCEGNSLNLSSSSATGNNWSDGSTTQDITVTQAGSYTLFFIDGNNCPSEMTSINIQEIATPSKPEILEADANGEIDLCVGAEIIISTGATNDLISWSSGETTKEISVNTAGTYNVTVTNAEGCSSTSDDVELISRALPTTPTISAEDGLNEICEGENLTLSATADANNTFQWNGDESINTPDFNVEVEGDYFVTAFNEFGCGATSDLYSVAVNALPTQPTITSSNGTDQFCEGETFSLTCDASGDFYWNGDVTITTADILISETGTYFVTAVSAEGCENESEKIEITLNGLPSQPEISDVNGTLTSSVADGSLEFQWFTADGNPVVGETAPTYQDAPDGTYYIVVTDPQTGCQNQSEEFNHTTISISELNAASDVQIFPNPVAAGNNIKVVTEQAYQGLLLMETTGKVVATANAMEINTQGLAPGIYFLHAINQNNLITLGKVVVK